MNHQAHAAVEALFPAFPLSSPVEAMHVDNFYRSFAVLSSPELRSLFEERINFPAW